MLIPRNELKLLAEQYVKLKEQEHSGIAFQEQIKSVFFDEMVYGEVVETYLGFVGSKARGNFIDRLPHYTQHGGVPLSIVKDFLTYYFAELRRLICGDKKTKGAEKEAEAKRKSLIVGLSAWITAHFGVTEPVAIGVSAYLAIILFEATRGAFCAMSKKEIEKRIKQIEERRR